MQFSTPKNEQSVRVHSTGRCDPTPRIAHDPGLTLAGTRRTNQDVTANGTGNNGMASTSSGRLGWMLYIETNARDTPQNQYHAVFV